MSIFNNVRKNSFNGKILSTKAKKTANKIIAVA
jgi:hypothetical protein